jgi:plastocyanin
MAKKTKTVKKKVASTAGKRQHHWDHHDFLLVVAGGFIVIILIFMLSGSFKSTVPPLANSEAAGENAAKMDNQTEKSITISEFTYAPDPLVVKKGTTVTWTNTDTIAHSATADDGSFDTGFLENGESGSVTFSDVGEYAYHSSVYPNVTGKVIVKE